MKTTKGITDVATIIFNRGHSVDWGAEGNDMESCIELVKGVVADGLMILDDECDGDEIYECLAELVQDRLGLEPDYIDDLWISEL